jgi:hypothetical protein
MNDRAQRSPATASPGYDEFVDRYGLEILKQPGDLQIVDGDLALTKDLDLMMGDNSYNALFRLAEYWRHNAAHIALLMDLLGLMIDRHDDANRRLENAMETDAQRKRETGQFFSWSPDFLAAWHKHYDEEGTAISGQMTYSGCVIMLASNALTRFRDDLDCPSGHWKQCGPQYGGHSAGEIVIASANGFRHADEWVKTRPMKPIQLKSANVLTSALGPARIAGGQASRPGRCQEVIKLLAGGSAFDGFTQVVFSFAHAVAVACGRESKAGVVART